MIRNRFLRVLIGLALGGLAGVSLCVSVLPAVLDMAGLGASLALGYFMKQYIAHAALIMAIGGWSAVRVRQPLAGALVLGPAGLATGLYLSFMGLSGEPRALIFGALGGLVYGALGGLILGRISAPASRPGDDDEADPHETAGLP
jgi:hypothetical protein